MSELLKTGELEPVAKIAQKVTGQRPTYPTVWRWVKKGVSNGTKLEAVPIYTRWHTTEAAFRDFLSRRAEAEMQPRETVPAASDDDLRAAGLL